MPNHAAGKKISGRHTTLIDVARPIVKTAEGLDCVTKIVLGLIQQAKGTAVSKSLKILNVQAGLRLKVRGSKTVQEIFIYTRDRHKTATEVTKAFEGL
jgi:hypothetical protein